MCSLMRLSHLPAITLALSLRPEKSGSVRKSAVRSLRTIWWRSGSSQGLERVDMNYPSTLVSGLPKTSAAGRRSDESGVMTQYSRHGSAKRTTRSYRGRSNNAKRLGVAVIIPCDWCATAVRSFGSQYAPLTFILRLYCASFRRASFRSLYVHTALLLRLWRS